MGCLARGVMNMTSTSYLGITVQGLAIPCASVARCENIWNNCKWSSFGRAVAASQVILLCKGDIFAGWYPAPFIWSWRCCKKSPFINDGHTLCLQQIGCRCLWTPSHELKDRRGRLTPKRSPSCLRQVAKNTIFWGGDEERICSIMDWCTRARSTLVLSWWGGSGAPDVPGEAGGAGFVQP